MDLSPTLIIMTPDQCEGMMDGKLEGPSLGGEWRHWSLPGDKVDTASGPVLSDSRGDVPGDLASEGAQL